MIPLLPILNGIGLVTELYLKAKGVKQQVTGTPSEASTPDELKDEITSLSPEQQKRFIEAMNVEIEAYAKQNERLAIEAGLVDENITSKVTTEAADDIAIMRQTTRPWVVRMCMHYIMFPFYLVIVDSVQLIAKAWLFFWTEAVQPVRIFEYVFGANDLGALGAGILEKIGLSGGFIPKTMAGQLYIDSVMWVASIIIAYMGLREVGKIKGVSDKGVTGVTGNIGTVVNTVAKVTSTTGKFVGMIKDAFNKKK